MGIQLEFEEDCCHLSKAGRFVAVAKEDGQSIQPQSQQETYGQCQHTEGGHTNMA